MSCERCAELERELTELRASRRMHPDDIKALAAELKKKQPRNTAKTTTATPEQLAEAERWFAVWAQELGYVGRFAFGGERRDIALQRIREGRTLEQWTKIVRWVKNDDHMRGRNGNRPYDDFENLAATGKKFEKYLNIALRAANRASTTDAGLFKGTSTGEGRRL